jgi:hypothetical protein
MASTPPMPVTDWVADPGVTNHTTPHPNHISTPSPPLIAHPSSIVVGNGSVLPIISVGDLVFLGPFYLNDVLVAPDLVQSLLSIRCFTTDNSCNMEFDPFVLSVKDLATRHVLPRYDSIGLLYTLPLPTSTTPTPRDVMYTLATTTPRDVPYTPAPMSSPCCRVAQLSPALEVEMIPCVMLASLVGTSGFPFLAPLLELFNPLTLYTVTFGPPLFQVSLVTSITWSSLITAPTTQGVFHYTRSLTPSPPSPTSSPLCPYSLATPSGESNAIMDVSFITPPSLSASITVSLHFPTERQG